MHDDAVCVSDAMVQNGAAVLYGGDGSPPVAAGRDPRPTNLTRVYIDPTQTT